MDYCMPWRSIEPLKSQWGGHLFGYVEYVTANIQDAWKWDDPTHAAEMTASLKPSQMALWAVLNANGQICNGGFSQFFFNSYGELAEEALQGFRLLGMAEYADILEQAYAAFPARPIPKSRETRIALLDQMSAESTTDADSPDQDPDVPEFIALYSAMAKATAKRWDALESRYYELIHEEGVPGGYDAAFFRPLALYIESHPDEFFLPGSN